MTTPWERTGPEVDGHQLGANGCAPATAVVDDDQDGETTRADAYPGAPETCYDGVEQDGRGERISERRSTPTATATPPRRPGAGVETTTTP